jgi:predicted enzyme related to lactoylglutathione lyase
MTESLPSPTLACSHRWHSGTLMPHVTRQARLCVLKEVPVVIGGVSTVVVEVEDQERAKRFWNETLGFEVVQDAAYGEERWLEVRTPDKAVALVLDLRKGPRPTTQDPSLPTANVSFYADDLQQTHAELTARGVTFPQPPIQQPFGWWSIFEDPDGNRFALVPHGQ